MAWIDPLDNTITLDDICWRNHILRRHPIMKGCRPRIARTVSAPTLIMRSRIDPTSRLYYRDFNWRFGKCNLVVVVGADNHVKTAFPVFNLRKGKEVIWPTS